MPDNDQRLNPLNLAFLLCMSHTEGSSGSEIACRSPQTASATESPASSERSTAVTKGMWRVLLTHKSADTQSARTARRRPEPPAIESSCSVRGLPALAGVSAAVSRGDGSYFLCLAARDGEEKSTHGE